MSLFTVRAYEISFATPCRLRCICHIHSYSGRKFAHSLLHRFLADILVYTGFHGNLVRMYTRSLAYTISFLCTRWMTWSIHWSMFDQSCFCRMAVHIGYQQSQEDKHK
uniref:Uncharacterized protein n=1 Tax=Cacopsylla melanoneura TaxID=428564 RepID=A0A8D8TMD7_9HEMI